MYTPDSSFKIHVICLNLPCVPPFLSHTWAIRSSTYASDNTFGQVVSRINKLFAHSCSLRDSASAATLLFPAIWRTSKSKSARNICHCISLGLNLGLELKYLVGELFEWIMNLGPFRK